MKLAVAEDALKFCDDPVLVKYEYRKINFQKHRFLMVYRIDDGKVIVDGMFHELQDYEDILTRELHLE